MPHRRYNDDRYEPCRDKPGNDVPQPLGPLAPVQARRAERHRIGWLPAFEIRIVVTTHTHSIHSMAESGTSQCPANVSGPAGSGLMLPE
jgi:hypothetical protein